jgi:hypothetical protein
MSLCKITLATRDMDDLALLAMIHDDIDDFPILRGLLWPPLDTIQQPQPVM